MSAIKSITVTINGTEFSSVKQCCEHFGINKNKVYKYKSDNQCTYEEAILHFIPKEQEEDLQVVTEPTPIAPPIEEESAENVNDNELINENNSAEEESKEDVKDEEPEKEIEVIPISDEVEEEKEDEETMTEEELKEQSKLKITYVEKKPNIFRRFIKWLFGK